MNDDLKYTFSIVNDWLKFAEAKNAGLLALNLAAIIGLIQGEQVFGSTYKLFEGILIIAFCISSCVCLYTILPVVNKLFRFYKKMNETEFNNSIDNLNALFFGDISKLSSVQFIKLFEHKHNLRLSNPEKDFGNQITNNAEICLQKYALFKVAAWISFGAFVMGAVLVIIKAFI